jgi:type III secretion system HrpE/YscL family protein
MSLLVLDARRGLSVASEGGSRISGEVFAALRDADEVLRAAEYRAAVIRAEGEAAAAAQAAAARESGFAAGRADGVAAVLGTLEIERRLVQLLADRIAGVVEQTVRNVLGEFEPKELFARRVRHMLQTRTDTSAAAVLHVAPEQLHLAHEAVDELAKANGAEFTWLTLLGDEACAHDALVLETRSGFVDASIELSLKSARDIIAKAVTVATSNMGS